MFEWGIANQNKFLALVTATYPIRPSSLFVPESRDWIFSFFVINKTAPIDSPFTLWTVFTLIPHSFFSSSLLSGNSGNPVFANLLPTVSIGCNKCCFSIVARRALVFFTRAECHSVFAISFDDGRPISGSRLKFHRSRLSWIMQFSCIAPWRFE